MRKISSHVLLITIVGIIIYSNTLNSSFIWDDKDYIIENPIIKNYSNFLDISEPRYVTFLTFAINYSLGSLNTSGYHMVNLIIHILNAILIYILIILTFRTPFFDNATAGFQPDESQLRLIALFSALFFVSHPVQTQAVSYITQRFASLATFFYLLSLVLYIKWRLTIQSTESRGQRADYTLYAASIISALLAMKTKEISFTLPFIMVLYEFSFLRSQQFKISKLRLFIYLLPFLMASAIIPLTFIAPEWGIFKPESHTAAELKQEKLRDLTTLSKYNYLLTQFRVIVTYIRLLFFPVNQHLLYDYPVFHSFLNPQVFLSFLFLLLTFALGIYLFYRSRFTDHSSRLVAFGILWFFITLSVESSIIPIKHVIFEHRVYLPSIGIIIAFVSGIFYVLRFKSDNSPQLLKINYVLLAAIILFLSAATYQRNSIWENEISLWKDSIKKSPNNRDAHHFLGSAYYKQGKLDEAVQEYLIALKLRPDSRDIYIIHNNLGLAYYEQDQFNEAIKEYKTILEFKPDYTEAHYHLGNIYYKQGRYDKAIQEFNAALSPASATHSFDNVHSKQGNLKKSDLSNTLWAYQPCFASVHFNLGRVYLAQGNIDNAARKFKVAAILRPDFVEAHYNLGDIYQRQGTFDEAIKEYQAVLELSPNHAEARNNLKILLRKRNNH